MTRQHPYRCSALRFLRRAVLAWLVIAPVGVLAHDTWFEVKRQLGAGDFIVALGTGNRFPVQEYPIDRVHLQRHGCTQHGREVPFVAVTNSSTALLLRASAANHEPMSCWAQLIPFDVELPLDKVEIYLKEINASQSVREAWSAMKAQGLPWKERYVKHARIEFAGDTKGDEPTRRTQPVNMGMDAIIESGWRSIQASDTVVFQILRDALPLTDFAVELINDRHNVSFWGKTDADGRIRIEVPHPGRWVLRGTDLRVSQRNPNTWESRFLTLAFEVGDLNLKR